MCLCPDSVWHNRCANTLPRRLVRLARLRVQLVDREVPKHELGSVAALGLELGQSWQHALAEGAVKVREHDDGHRCYSGPLARAPSVATWARKTGLGVHRHGGLGAEGAQRTARGNERVNVLRSANIRAVHAMRYGHEVHDAETAPLSPLGCPAARHPRGKSSATPLLSPYSHWLRSSALTFGAKGACRA
jgi:hypothetical protein